jgi:hypothetical protein
MPITNPRIRELAERAWQQANNNALTATKLLSLWTGLNFYSAFEAINDDQVKPREVRERARPAQAAE